jgi:Secretion system C-terminal sorting domain
MQNKNIALRLLGKLIMLLVFCLCVNKIQAQSWNKSIKQNLPMATSNNAVCCAANGTIFTFGGIDTTKIYSGIHQKVFANIGGGNTWTALLDVPDTLGKLGVAASYLKNKIYLIGGYHVFNNGTEKSSTNVHVFDVPNVFWNLNAAALPVAIDDHVQAVWRDSLIYVITGWSNTTNVNTVQIFNPTINNWLSGDAVPNNNFYKAFGASGTIVGDTIYYFGGASNGTNFPATNILRKGIIIATDPTKITWSYTALPQLYGYRMACTQVDDYVCWIGGSAQSYNYNGLAYSNGQGVANLNRALFYNYKTGAIIIDSSNSYNMDYRGIGNLNNTTKYLVGGMHAGQQVSDSCFKLNFNTATTIQSLENKIQLALYPNPSQFFINIKTDLIIDALEIINTNGTTVFKCNNICNKLNITTLAAGAYFVKINIGQQQILKPFLKN